MHNLEWIEIETRPVQSNFLHFSKSAIFTIMPFDYAELYFHRTKFRTHSIIAVIINTDLPACAQIYKEGKEIGASRYEDEKDEESETLNGRSFDSTLSDV